MRYDAVFDSAPELTVVSSGCPGGRAGRGFIQPLDLESAAAAAPNEAGRPGGSFRLVAPAGTFLPGEDRISVCAGGREFFVLRWEELSAFGGGHVEALLRPGGRCGDA